MNGLKVFTSMNPDVFEELTSLLTLADIRFCVSVFMIKSS